jgi:hypothetical protein
MIPGRRRASLRKAQSVMQRSSSSHSWPVLANLVDGFFFRHLRINASMRMGMPALEVRRQGAIT